MEPAQNFPFNTLPLDMQSQIFSFLGEKSVGKNCLVSQEWNKKLSDNNVWNNLIPGINLIIPKDFKGSTKEYVKQRNIKPLKSLQDIPVVFKAFCDSISSHKNSLFFCTFPFNRDCFLLASYNEKKSLVLDNIYFEQVIPALQNLKTFDPPIDNKIEYILSEALPIVVNDDDVSGGTVCGGNKKYKFTWPALSNVYEIAHELNLTWNKVSSKQQSLRIA